MNQRSFYFSLALVSSLTALGLYLVHRFPPFQAHATLSLIGLAFFIGLSTAMYYFGLSAARSENKHNFTNVVMGFTVVKMMISALVVLAYFKIAMPGDKLFILPFFGVYLIYTIFETYFMTRLGRLNG